jgi:hypothetical protein
MNVHQLLLSISCYLQCHSRSMGVQFSLGRVPHTFGQRLGVLLTLCGRSPALGLDQVPSGGAA